MRALMPAILLGALALAAGCGGGKTKAGEEATAHAAVLTLADGESNPADIQPFIDRVSALSGGSMRIEVKSNWAHGDPDFERSVVEAVRSGNADLGRVLARVWDTFGVLSFQALQDPLLVDSYALQRRLFGGAIAAKMLAGLTGRRLVGIALFGGELRQVAAFGPRPLVTPAAFHGARIGIRDSRVTALTVRALAARPVVFKPGDIRGLDGIEIDLAGATGYADRVRYLTTNLDLWPRVVTIFANRASWRRLTPEQRALLRRAGAEAAPASLERARRLERDSAGNLCRGSAVTLVSVTSAQRAALQAALSPVDAALRRDVRTSSFVRSIERLKRSVGAPPDVVAPASCPAAGNAQPRQAAAQLVGTWTTSFTKAEFDSADREAGEELPSRSEARLTIRANGRFVYYGTPGTYVIQGDRITFDPEGSLEEGAGEEWRLRWSLFRGALTFRRIAHPTPTPFVINPWRKVG